MRQSARLIGDTIKIVYVHRYAYVKMKGLQLIIVSIVMLFFEKFALTMTGYTQLTRQNWYPFITNPIVQGWMVLLLVILLLLGRWEIKQLLKFVQQQPTNSRYTKRAIWQWLLVGVLFIKYFWPSLLAIVQIGLLFILGFWQLLFVQLWMKRKYAISTMYVTKKRINKHWSGVMLFLVLCLFNSWLLAYYENATQPKLIAHRSHTNTSVENTLTGLLDVASKGADLVEIDVQQTADGEFVVFHDRTLRRLAGKNGIITNMTLAELRKIPIYHHGIKEQIPSLDDFIVAAKQLKIPLVIELKIHGQETEDVLLQFAKKLQSYHVLDTYYVQSANVVSMKQLKKLVPRLRVGIVYALNVEQLEENMDFIAVEASWVNATLLKELQQRHIALFVWTVNDLQQLRGLMIPSIAGIITDEVAQAASVQRE
ncbi:glycerophosphodiester phosphodiesterase family protein [Lysinibacillus piscis]|uniref:GP-PDE domain-containing protein n=1 Tax=Lysinibacillus piscis TaxID=2518931 RepID=A0ABQ5NKE5_9BACI|nr:glycerophosphodiester phosphodiesterase family protein [Lysinibacillus sp. KH24]GLC88840.1 hypothetical protein LYSBPC_19670 [Lysinibacillus sp. KH24]